MPTPGNPEYQSYSGAATPAGNTGNYSYTSSDPGSGSGGIWQAAFAALGGGINALSTANTNKKQREYNKEMYERQYRDNIAFWNLQNEYNSPEQQMKRLQEAGLNPALIYGGSGNSGQAGSISTPDVQSLNLKTPEYGNMIPDLMAMYDIEIKQATADNLRAQNTVIQEEALLKSVQRRQSEFDLGLDSELREVSAEARREGLRQTRTSTDIAINRDAREAAMNASNIEEAAWRMASMKKQQAKTDAEINEINMRISLMRRDRTLKDIDIRLRKNGINPNDPLWARLVGQLIADYFDITDLNAPSFDTSKLPSMPTMEDILRINPLYNLMFPKTKGKAIRGHAY